VSSAMVFVVAFVFVRACYSRSGARVRRESSIPKAYAPSQAGVPSEGTKAADGVRKCR
jgi:hypothetical protein